jgi:hypothetical protein
MGERAALYRARDPEINQPGPVVGKQDIRGLEVAVHDPGGVNIGQALRQPPRQRQHRIRGQRPVVRDRLRQ